MFKRKTSHLFCGIVLMLLLVAGAAGGPIRVTGVCINARDGRETLHVSLEGAQADPRKPVCQDYAFQQAGYGYLEFPGAALAGTDREVAHEGPYIQRVSLSSRDGENVRVYFYLKKWTPYKIEREGEEVRVVFSEESGKTAGIVNRPDMFFSLSTSETSPDQSDTANPLDHFVNSVELKKQPIQLAQSTQKKGEMTFFVPPSGKETAPRAETALLPEEDIFAQLVTLRFKDADLQDVIRMIAQQTGLNVIMAKDQVKGDITLNLEDVPLGSALDAILKTHGLAFVREPGGIVRIVPRSEIRATTIELKTVHIPVNWVPADRLAQTLRPFLTKAEGAQIQADQESNALIITDTPPNVDTLIALEEKLDVPEKQVMIEMRLVDMGRDLLRQIGSEWSLTQSLQPERMPIVQTETIKNPITGQVEKIVETVTGYEEIPVDQIADRVRSFAAVGAPGGTKFDWGKTVSILGEDFDFDIFAEAYEQKGLVQVLANPKIITLNNIPAKIEIIEEIPYTDTVIGSGGAQTLQVEFKETGILMEVTPNITNNGYVRMTIKPEQKIYRGRDPIAGNNPMVDKRSAETNVIVRDEETVVLGGLRQYTDTITSKGTPWFMDIPVLGWLFKSHSVDNKVLELVMFVTPHIIKEPTLTEYEKLQYGQIDCRWDLPEDFFCKPAEEKQ